MGGAVWSWCWEQVGSGLRDPSPVPPPQAACAVFGPGRPVSPLFPRVPIYLPQRQHHLALSSRLHKHCRPAWLLEPSDPPSPPVQTREQCPAPKLVGCWPHGHLPVLQTRPRPQQDPAAAPRPLKPPGQDSPGTTNCMQPWGPGRMLRLGHPLQAPGGAPHGGPAEDNSAGGASVRCGDCGPQGAGGGVSALLIQGW